MNIRGKKVVAVLITLALIVIVPVKLLQLLNVAYIFCTLYGIGFVTFLKFKHPAKVSCIFITSFGISGVSFKLEQP